jgi:hypothetical protein
VKVAAASSIAVFVLTAAVLSGAAVAADLRGGGYYPSGGYGAAGAYRVYEFDTGQDPYYIRRYWDEPWLGRHYFPALNEMPRVGRVEKIPPADRKLPPPAETYYRYWSTPPGYEEEFMRVPPPAELPMETPTQK